MKQLILKNFGFAVLLGSVLFFSGCLFESPSKEFVVNSNKQNSGFFKEELSTNEKSFQKEEQSEDAVTSGNIAANIIVETPKIGDILQNPIFIQGKARVFENTVHVDIKKENGEVMISEIATAKAKNAGEFGEFEIQIRFYFRNTKTGFVEVYSLSPKDGSRENLVNIPVEFAVLK